VSTNKGKANATSPITVRSQCQLDHRLKLSRQPFNSDGATEESVVHRRRRHCALCYALCPIAEVDPRAYPLLFNDRRSKMSGYCSALVIVVLAGFSGCSNGGGSGGGDDASVVFDGEWEGTWQSQDPGPSGVVTLELNQLGTAVTGTATFDGHPCVVTCNVSCQVNGDEISGSFDAGPFQMHFAGSCGGPHHGSGPHHASEFTGSYEIHGGPCAGDYGTIQLAPTAADGLDAPEVYVGEVILIGGDESDPVRLLVFRRPDQTQ
jgi:hypothetical protein